MAKVKKASPGEVVSNDFIEVFGAREHNLKNIDIKVPKNKLVVFTGVSGSGKSSLAFDTIYNEGQRRYMESFSAYARQFVGDMARPGHHGYAWPRRDGQQWPRGMAGRTLRHGRAIPA